MQESVSGTTSQVRASERALKSKVHMIKITIVPKYHLFVAIGIVTRAVRS